ncbi:MAG: hypothetical protein LBE70_04690 [Nitrososphaerota archaeon]|jgi:hypothetical protein|nr:hypothetical protein [Nitrososphaerota archaeon]
MNWKNVLLLIQVERKSGRLLRGKNPSKYKENRFLANWLYLLAVVVGIIVGVFALFLSGTISDVLGIDVQSYAAYVFVTLPTTILITNAILGMVYQLQRSGVKMQAEAPYWLPITWQEHTLASVIASLLGIPLGIVLFVSSAIIVFSIFNGLLLLAIATSIAMFAAAFLTSTLTEILRVLQVRSMGAVHKSSGKSAIWVRFIGTLAFFAIFYVIYYTVILSAGNILLTLTDIQGSLFYVPFVWLGLALSNFFITGGSVLIGIVYTLLSVAFISALYSLAVLLNKRFGLYTPPAIKIQSGTYTPKTGILGKLGFSSVEAAVINKDFKAFTRRKELIPVFITPIVFMLIPLMQSFGLANTAIEPEGMLISFAMIFLLPSSFMSYMLGNFIIGEEGQVIWRIYASPISAKNLVKSKYFFVILFGLLILAITGAVGTILFKPTPIMLSVAILTAVFLIFALSAVSLNIGFRGADFIETPKPRMIRPVWMLLSMVSCVLIALAIMAPLLLSVVSSFLGEFGIINFPTINPFISVTMSGIIAFVITGLFYKFNLDTAKEFLKKAET